MPYGAKLRHLGGGDAQLELGAGVHTLAGSAGIGQTEYRAHVLLWERTASAEWRSVAGRLLSAMVNGPHTVGANMRESVPSPPLALQSPSNAHNCQSLSQGCWQRRNTVCSLSSSIAKAKDTRVGVELGDSNHDKEVITLEHSLTAPLKAGRTSVSVLKTRQSGWH